MTTKETISLPKGITDDIDRLIEELGYWPSRGAFVREACMEKIKREMMFRKMRSNILGVTTGFTGSVKHRV